MILGMGWPVANFIIFVGVLYYFLNQPLRDYLATRGSSIRKDLVEAAELAPPPPRNSRPSNRSSRRFPANWTRCARAAPKKSRPKRRALPRQAAADRERLLEQTRREIDLQVRLAKKEILEHAANLSVQLATERIKKEVTPADQERLVDRYLSQVKEQQ